MPSVDPSGDRQAMEYRRLAAWPILLLLLAAGGCRQSQTSPEVPYVPALSGEDAFSRNGRSVRALWFAVDGELRAVFFYSAHPLGANRRESGPNGVVGWWEQENRERLDYAFDPRFPDQFVIGGKRHNLSDGMILLGRTNKDCQQLPVLVSVSGEDAELYRTEVRRLAKENKPISHFIGSILDGDTNAQ